jgi:hypothetical protein
MAGTAWQLCPECFEKSRHNRAWYCPHCDYLKPKIKVWDITPLKAEVIKPRPKVVPQLAYDPKIARRLEKEQLAEDIAKLDRSKLPQLNLQPKVGLRRS